MDSNLLPLGRATASDIREVKEPGLLLPTRKNDEALLLTKFGDKMHGVMLTGIHAFIHFPISLKSPHYGLFVPDVEIVVDYSSASEGSAKSESEGVLILSQDTLSLIATQAGNDFGGPQPIPLWTRIEGGSDSCKVAFTKWGIGIRDRNHLIMLWEHEHSPVKSSVEVFA